MFKELQSRVSAKWCNLAHESVMWPVHGQYECRTCGRSYPAFAEAPLQGSGVQTARSGVAELPAAASRLAA